MKIPRWTSSCLVLLPLLASEAFATEGGCGEDLTHTTVETREIEVKFLVPELKFDADVEAALDTGEVTPRVPQRGFVLQQYLPPSPENLRHVFDRLRSLGVDFGTEAEQAEFLTPGVARELRLMSGSIKRRHGRFETRQVTIKGAGGVSIAQLETPRDIAPAKIALLASLFEELRPKVTGAVRKMYFEVAPDGAPVFEIDIFLGRSGIGAPPIFVNGEAEFHGADALATAEAYRRADAERPAFLGRDLTDAPGLKSRDLAGGDVPADVALELKSHRARNHAFAERLRREFVTWADPRLAAEILYPRVDVDVRMIDPQVFRPDDVSALREHFFARGYVVVDGVSSPEARAKLIDLMSRVADAVPSARRLGFMDIYHDDALAQLRQDPRLHRVFAALFGTEKLWAVFDRVMYWRRDEPDLPLPPHVDQNPVTHPDFFAAQGMLALRDMDEGTGTLALAPGSHRQFGAYAPWASPGAGFVEWRGRYPGALAGVRLKAGQIVIWDSRVTHGRTRGEPTGDRFAALLTFAPAADDETLRARRIDVFTRGVGASDPAAALRATARPRYELSLRESPERLTDLGRKLYGVSSWFSSP